MLPPKNHSEIICATCGKTDYKLTGGVNRARRNGSNLYCSRKCSDIGRTTGRKALGWHERRFEERQGTVKSECENCGASMWLPPSKVHEYKRCGVKCNEEWREKLQLSRKRECETCGSDFFPRSTQIAAGAGRWCSHKCQPSVHLSTPEALAFAQQRRRENQAAGLIAWKTGERHHSWKGGIKAHLERRRASGKSAETLRKYRANNKHKVHEFKLIRQGRKFGRLARGTIPKIGGLQRWKCAICRVGIKKVYHVDHIIPLAKGGQHISNNIQLLCPSCNVRKSARDPIDYMQMLGRLL